MEREPSPMPPKDLRLTAVEENTLSSQVLELALEALQTLDQPEDRDVWLIEEGDDSVFYSDEDQTDQDIKSNTSCDFGAKKSKCPVNSEAHEEPILQGEGGPGADAIIDKENIEMEKEAPFQFNLAEREFQTSETETMCQSLSAESLQPNCTNADMQTQAKPSISSETANVQIKEEKVALETHTPNLDPFDMLNKVSFMGLNREGKDLEQMPSAELKTPSNRELEAEQQPEQDHNFHVPLGCHHDPSPGCSALPLPKTSGQSSRDHNSFDHLRSSRYRTVSYRNIRRGNTRQKIEEFEHMVIN